MNKILLLTPLLLSLVACGGGESDTTVADKEEEETTTLPLPEDIKDTSEITSTDEFEFKSSWEMSVSVNIPETPNGLTSICSGFTDKGDGTYVIDYSTCSIQATLDNQGSLSSTLNITNEVESLVGVIWPIDQSDPLYQNFTITNGQETLAWNQ